TGCAGRRHHRRQDAARGLARTVHQPGHRHADPQVMHEAATRKRTVMAGHSRPKDGVASASLRPAIHDLFAPGRKKDVDARIKPGHDEWRMQPRARSTLTRILLALPAAAISLFVSSPPAFADLKLCNRMSYVVE